jgi:mannose-6-phosphate isomerase
VPGADGEEVYPAPVDDFRLSRLVLGGQDEVRVLCGSAPQILVCTQGRIHFAGPREELVREAGRSAYAPVGEEIRVSGRGTLFRATAAIPSVN